MRVAACASLIVLALNCAPSLPPEYVQHSSAAREAYSQGRYEQAAEHWSAAHSVAPSAKYRDESLYRQAMSLKRAGRHDEARQLLAQLAAADRAGRTVRAEFDLAYDELERGDSARGKKLLERALLRHPSSGLSVRAALRLLDEASESGGNAERAQYIQRLLSALPDDAEVRELLEYEHAKALETGGSTEAALHAYDQQVRRYPYPTGRYWNESLVRSAKILAATGRARNAISTLRWMLKHRESSAVTGSYERRYADAQFLLATTLKEEGDCGAARDEFRVVFSAYPHSLLRDDALWQASLCSIALREPDQACLDLERLLENLPGSRYASCAERLCPALTDKRETAGPCPEYILQNANARDNASR